MSLLWVLEFKIVQPAGGKTSKSSEKSQGSSGITTVLVTSIAAVPAELLTLYVIQLFLLPLSQQFPLSYLHYK